MRSAIAELENYASVYRQKKVPPPHILLIGPDDGLNTSIAETFAIRLGLRFFAKRADTLQNNSDLTELLLGGNVGFLSNVQHLNRQLVERLARDLPTGEWQIQIGAGPAARIHKLDLSSVVLIGSCPTKYDCPSPLMKAFEAVLVVETPIDSELISILEAEAWKDRISFDRDAAELFVRAGKRQTTLILAYFRRVCTVIEKIKLTNRPHLTQEEVLAAFERLRTRVPEIGPPKPPRDLQDLSGQDFERVIKTLLDEMGFETELTKLSGDGGIDIVATLNKPFVAGRYLFQCKRYAPDNLVGSPEIRDFYGAVMADRAHKGVFITTSDFTVQAKAFALHAGVELVNARKLFQLFDELGLTDFV